MRLRLLSSLLAATAFFFNSHAQTDSIPPSPADSVAPQSSAVGQASRPMAESTSWFKRNNVLDHVSVAFTVGTPGLGFELQAPVTKWANVRAGLDGIPRFHFPMTFPVATYAEGKVNDNFDKIKEMMLKMTGEEMHEEVKMTAKPKMLNFKFLVDIFPFQQNRHWHVTAGFYLGGSTVGTAINDMDETSTLVAMNIYNRFYTRLKKYGYEHEPIFGDVYLDKEQYEELMSYGLMGIHIGDNKDGTPYYMTPASNGTVSAKAFANAFKPYLGLGYSGAVDKARRLNIGFEAGVLFWGGAPDIILHDGVNMTKDLINIRGKVGDYVDFMKALKVYPCISFKISYDLL